MRVLRVTEYMLQNICYIQNLWWIFNTVHMLDSMARQHKYLKAMRALLITVYIEYMVYTGCMVNFYIVWYIQDV